MICKFSKIVKLTGNHKRTFIDIDKGKWYFNSGVTNLLQVILQKAILK
ncbi:unnamed protein product [marine sediment metagenome]|uniref:Uncharacterized protein n=1 Tax=marine sediment metagenome TaxID=412755 RepID=X1FDF2_9ZZZZ